MYKITKHGIHPCYLFRGMVVNCRHFLICLILILSTFGVLDLELTETVSAAGDSDGVLVVDTKLVVSGTYDIVRVKPTGHLIVETVLEASRVMMEAGSVMELTGGKLKLIDSDTPGARVTINGTCSTFKIIKNSEIDLIGSTGSSFIGKSTGGDAVIDLRVIKDLIIENSNITVRAGQGYTKPSTGADTTGTVEDFQYAGGNATVLFNLTQTTETVLKKSTILITGGSGGKAPDGEGGSGTNVRKGGGYSNGGTVSGFVGSGGSAELKFSARADLILKEMNITITGGRGGNAGTGNTSTTELGGGGGGYSGGDGGYRKAGEPEKALGKSGGAVGGMVGSGGYATFEILSMDSVSVYGGSFKVFGGRGGDAGPHIELSTPNMMGGVGGSGYGGGGGGSGYASTVGTMTSAGGSGGNISGSVGRGGNAKIYFNIKDELFFSDNTINATGGNGGNAGTGSKGKTGGGGGGGYGGGGGGGGAFMDIGNITSYGGNGGAITGNVGSGGDAFTTFNSSKSIMIYNSNVFSIGGSGGKAGDGGIVDSTKGGSGGGGYGGGGGGGKNGNWIGGGGGNGGTVSGSVGCGGNAWFLSSTTAVIEMLDSDISIFGGPGGPGGKGGEYKSGIGGGGGGGYGGGGGGGGSASDDGGAGGTGTLSSSKVAGGGNAEFQLSASKYSISRSSGLRTFRGRGGESTDLPGSSGGSKSSGFGSGGSGSGLTADHGNSKLKIPMGTPGLKGPENNMEISNTVPTFSWVPQHNSTDYGALTGHRLEIDLKPSFTTPVVIAYTKEGSYTLKNPLKDGKYYWHIRAEYGGNTPGWSETRSFAIDTTPAFFENPGPQTWSKELQTNITIEIGDEQSSVDIGSIQFAVSTTDTAPSSFGTWTDAHGVIDLSGDQTRVLAWAKPVLTKGVNNYVKWRACDTVSKLVNESAVHQVKIDVDPPIISIFSPRNNSWLSDTRPTFSWNGMDYDSGLSGNCTFELFKFKDGVKGNKIYTFENAVAFNSSFVFSFEIESDLEYGSYIWHVKIEDIAGHWSSWSEDFIINIDTVQPVVTGLSPGEDNWVAERPEFIWSAVDTFSGISEIFMLDIAKDSAFDQLIYRIEGDGSDLIAYSNGTYEYQWLDQAPLTGGSWFWRVRMLGNEGLWSEFCEPLSFRVDTVKPRVIPSSPLNGSWQNYQLELSWFAEDNGSGLTGRYRIQISEEREFIKPVFDKVVNIDPYKTGPVDEDQNGSVNSMGVYLKYTVDYKKYQYVYYWRVYAEDRVGLWSTPSDISEYKIDLKAPGITLISPGNRDYTGSPVVLKWKAEDPLSGLSGEYRVQLSSDSEFSKLIINTTISGPVQNNVPVEYKPEGVLPEGELYWRASANDRAGNWCPFSISQAFRLDITGVKFESLMGDRWYNTGNVSFEIQMTDYGSGVDTSFIYYRTSTSGTASYGDWHAAGTNSIEYLDKSIVKCTVVLKLDEGVDNFVQFKAKDHANSVYQQSPNYRVQIDLSELAFSDAVPASGSWQESTTVECGITIFDLYSGVNESSIEYRYSTGGTDQFGDWNGTNISTEAKPGGDLQCSVELVFKPGEENFIQFRAMDNAGNGYYLSDPHRINVRVLNEGETSDKMDPSIDEDQGGGRKWSGKIDGIFLLRLILIIIVLIVLIGFLKRHSSRDQSEKGTGRPGERRSSGKRKGTRINNKSGSEPEDQEDLEEIMAALDLELTDKYHSGTNGHARINKFEPPFKTALDEKHAKPAKKRTGPGDPNRTKTGEKHKRAQKKHFDQSRCVICLGKFKEGAKFNKCKCGNRFHSSCYGRTKKCPGCRRKI